MFLIAVSQLAPSNFRQVFEFLTACQIFWAIFEMKTQVPAFLTFLKGTISWWEEGGGSERTGWGPRGGGLLDWLLQAFREQDRWLDTGQSYTAKGCKGAM